MKADLHMHTTESDGKLTREELFQRASNKNVDLISITDHDTCKYVEDNQRLSKQYGVQYLPGIELSTLYKGKNVHILGYFKDDGYNAQTMKDYYVTIKQGREDRAKKFIKNLKQFYNIEINYEDILSVSHGIIARPHIAKAIIKSYPEYTHNEVFDRFIGEHTKAFVPSTELEVHEGIKLLRDHGCVIVLAHPKLLNKTIHDHILTYDFDGIEALYGMNYESDTQFYTEIARRRNLLITAGSDYHGIEDDTKHKDIGDVALEGDDLDRFLNALKS